MKIPFRIRKICKEETKFGEERDRERDKEREETKTVNIKTLNTLYIYCTE